MGRAFGIILLASAIAIASLQPIRGSRNGKFSGFFGKSDHLSCCLYLYTLCIAMISSRPCDVKILTCHLLISLFTAEASRALHGSSREDDHYLAFFLRWQLEWHFLVDFIWLWRFPNGWRCVDSENGVGYMTFNPRDAMASVCVGGWLTIFWHMLLCI
jgi:hypothetical protein